ncbi:hypothetical protein [Fimbriiglobus ruber]|uniref:hypothetical protein n=1 Tax=Fimbriiglobus ruber TaxID=1908690 RepID=UPI00187909B8|nr:hypothetical protein [Fimbriiglobus ruber]
MRIVRRVRIGRILPTRSARLGTHLHPVIHDLARLREDRHAGLVAGPLTPARMVGETLDQPLQIVRHVLPGPVSIFRRRTRDREESGRRRCGALTQLRRQRRVIRLVMTLDLREKPLDGHAHQAGAAEAAHVAEGVRGIEPLPIDGQLKVLDQLAGDGVHDLGGQFVIDKEGAVAFECAIAHLIAAGFEIEGVRDVGPKEVGIDGFGRGPVVHLLEEEQAGDGIAFLGGTSDGGIAVFAELANGHELEE